MFVYILHHDTLQIMHTLSPERKSKGKRKGERQRERDRERKGEGERERKGPQLNFPARLALNWRN